MPELEKQKAPAHPLWMIRTEKNELWGPFEKQRVLELIRQGRIGSRDEVCCGNHFWILLDDREEVPRQLGIAPLQAKRSQDDEEITETEINKTALLETTEVQQADMPAAPSLAAPASTSAKDLDVPELDHEGSLTEDTAILSNRALRHFQAARKNATSPPPPVQPPPAPVPSAKPQVEAAASKALPRYEAQVSGVVEKTSVWKGLAVFLVVTLGSLLGLLLWILRSS